LALARVPKPVELPVLLQALDHYAARYRDDPTAALEPLGKANRPAIQNSNPENWPPTQPWRV